MPDQPSVSDLAYRKAERRIAQAIEEGATELNLSIKELTRIPPLDHPFLQANLERLDVRNTAVSDLAPLATLTHLRSLNVMSNTAVSDLAPLAGLTKLELLDVRNTAVSDLAPLAGLTKLELLDVSNTAVSGLAPLATLTSLRFLHVRNTAVSDLAPLATLTSLELLDVRNTAVSDLAPLAGLTRLIDVVVPPISLEMLGGGLYVSSENLPPPLCDFAELDNPERTIKIINYLRQQQGLPEYYPPGYTPPTTEADFEAMLAAVEHVPAPYAFELTEKGTIGLSVSSANQPFLPRADSAQDHRNRLETCRTLASDLIVELSQQRYQVRSGYLLSLQKYAERLPNEAGSGNFMLADAEELGLRQMFEADAAELCVEFASKLRSLLTWHIGLRAYYPQMATFYRDVQQGHLTEPLPLDAVEGVVRAIQEATPSVFEPGVAEAVRGVAEPDALPPLPAPAVHHAPNTILPPQNPLGSIDPHKAHDVGLASTVAKLGTALRSVIRVAAELGRDVTVLIAVWHAIQPSLSPVIEWLAKIVPHLH